MPRTSNMPRMRRDSITARHLAIVTGANRDPGIGLEIVRGLLAGNAPEGSVVLLTARSPVMGQEAVEALNVQGVTDVVFHQLDVTDAVSVEALRKHVIETYDGVDVLVNNAGLAFP